MGIAVPFPSQKPNGYELLDDEPAFSPSKHLALEMPAKIVMLADLGYTDEEIAATATPVAASSPFRLLSEAGAAVMLDTARRLRQYVRPAGDRIERTVRGGCYRSRWLRDLCTSQEVSDHLAAIYGVAVAPHPMPLHLGHMNYEPTRLEAAVDKWHHDTLPLDFVMMVTDPTITPGGRFEYFAGTKHEAAAFAEAGETPPRDRVVVPDFVGPGYAIALHGNMVVHRGAPLDDLAERITMVNGYVSLDPTKDGQSRCADLIVVDDPELLWAEWAKYAGWRAQGRLDHLMTDLAFDGDMESVASRLERAVADVTTAVAEMRAGVKPADHYGG